MINMNLTALRKRFHMTQEEVAEKINVTRQAIAKWEKGESVPDMDNCIALADLFQVSLDELIRHDEKETGLAIAPKGKYFFGSVTVGDWGLCRKNHYFTLMNSISDKDLFIKKKTGKETEDE